MWIENHFRAEVAVEAFHTGITLRFPFQKDGPGSQVENWQQDPRAGAGRPVENTEVVPEREGGDLGLGGRTEGSRKMLLHL